MVCLKGYVIFIQLPKIPEGNFTSVTQGSAVVKVFFTHSKSPHNLQKPIQPHRAVYAQILLAPGETERTCRKVGAHIKAEAKTKTPVQKEYDRVYNRLKQQRYRGKISSDEWNALVTQALELKDRAERGELPDEEMGRG